MEPNSISPSDVYVPMKIEENDLYAGITELLQILRPSWARESLNFKIFTDGITNKLIACKTEDNGINSEVILVRIYGNKTDLLIDRNAELRNMRILNKVGLAPQIHGAFKNGLAYEYYPGVTLNPKIVLDPKIWTLVAQKMAKMHQVDLGKEVLKKPMLWDKIEQFLNLLPEPFTNPNKHMRFVNCFGSVTKLRLEYEHLKSHLTRSRSPIVFAHNDLLLGNVIHNEVDGAISFIDYEYAAYNYQAFDIANHFNEFVGLNIEDIDYEKYPSENYQKAWIKVYLKEYQDSEPTDAEVNDVYEKVNQFALTSHFLWGIWSLVQFELSDIDFDFGRYAEIRLQRFFDLKDGIYKKFSLS